VVVQVPGGAQKKELLENLDKVPTFVQRLQFTVKDHTVGKAATFTKVDNVIQETKNLMNVISKVVTVCFECATKVSHLLQHRFDCFYFFFAINHVHVTIHYLAGLEAFQIRNTNTYTPLFHSSLSLFFTCFCFFLSSLKLHYHKELPCLVMSTMETFCRGNSVLKLSTG